MNTPGFLFGAGTPWTHDELVKKREMADMLMQNFYGSQPRNLGEGIGAIADLLASKRLGKRAAKEDERMRNEFNSQFGSAFSGGGGNFGSGGAYGGGSYTAPPPKSQWDAGTTETPEQKAAREAASMGSWNGGAVSDMQPNMVSTFGQDTPGMGKSGYNMGATVGPETPVDFASYEQQYGLPAGYLGAVGTVESNLNPNAQNPNSSAGGMFQFIDSTAQQYGLTNKMDPVASTDAAARLAADNAKYLVGVLGRAPTAGELYLAHQQGAGNAAKLLSNPNAPADQVLGGEAFRLNGGKPGMTAADFASQWTNKVDSLAPQFGGSGGPSMAPFNPAMFGKIDEGQTPQQPQQPGMDFTGGMGGGAGGMPGSGFDIATLANLASSPYASEGQKAIINALMTQQMNAMDPMYRLQLEQEQLNLAKMQGGGDGMRPMTPDEMAQWGIPPNSGSWGIGPDGTPKQIMEAPGARGGVEYGTSVNYYTKEDGTVGGYIIGKDGSRKEVELPEGGQFGSGTQRVDLGDRWQIIDNRTGTVLREEKKELVTPEADQAIGAAAGKVASSLPTIEANANAALERIEAVINDPGLDSIAGNIQGRLPSGLPMLTGGQEGANSAAALAEIQGKLFLAAYDALRGAGAITETEGKAATDAIANLDLTQDPKMIRAALRRAADKLKQDVENARKKAAQGGGTAAGISQSPAPSGDIPQVSTDADYDALPVGVQFIAPDGTVRVKQ